MNTQTTVAVSAARKAVYDKVEAQINTLGAQLATLKAKAESAKANAEIAAIANLAKSKLALDAKVADLKSAGEVKFETVKADMERRLAEFDQSLQAVKSKFNGR